MRPGEPLILWPWVFSHLPDIRDRVVEHLELTFIAIGVGLVLSFALSLIVLRVPRTYGPVTWVTGILYTIPSLALFSLLIPFTGLSIVTAEIGLVSYTLLILIRNILAGLEGVPREVREAAEGMGFSRARQLLRIELPLAAPVIVAGIRIATVTTIGLVTVTGLIGQGGLGAFIIEGINRDFRTPLVVGSVLSIALAVVADVALAGATRLLSPWSRR